MLHCLQQSAHEDELSSMETKTEEMSNQLEEVKYELEKTMRREDKLDYRLAEVTYFWDWLFRFRIILGTKEAANGRTTIIGSKK